MSSNFATLFIFILPSFSFSFEEVSSKQVAPVDKRSVRLMYDDRFRKVEKINLGDGGGRHASNN